MTITQVIRLLRRPIPTDEHAGGALARLEALAEPIDWPSPETSYDDDLLTSATVLFLQPARADRAKRALRIALGGEKFELLIGFLTFIRSAHYWTLMHPEFAFEDDVKVLLREHQELAQLLTEDPEAGRCEMGARLFEELESLRNLNERQELKKAKLALEESGRQKDLLLKEVDHRIKNSLQIVSSLLHMQARTAGAAAGQFHNAAARVAAIAAVHQQLQNLMTSERWRLTSTSSTFVGRSQRHRAVPIEPGRSQSMPTRSSSALTSRCRLALIVNELITNAIQHSRPSGAGGRVQIVLTSASDNFSISVSDPGDGPPPQADTQTSGLGTRIVDALARQIDAMITKGRDPAGYAVTVTVPLRADRALDQM